jgi:hypothetical protein
MEKVHKPNNSVKYMYVSTLSGGMEGKMQTINSFHGRITKTNKK